MIQFNILQVHIHQKPEVSIFHYSLEISVNSSWDWVGMQNQGQFKTYRTFKSIVIHHAKYPDMLIYVALIYISFFCSKDHCHRISFTFSGVFLFCFNFLMQIFLVPSVLDHIFCLICSLRCSNGDLALSQRLTIALPKTVERREVTVQSC